jgi:hypothetical protein
LLLVWILMADDDFGPSLRKEREWRRISLDEIALATKVSADLWEGMERNDFSRWPSGIFARAFVRDYARVVGLDGDAVVNEFCRQFPVGDRRADRIVEAQAELLGHRHSGGAAELLPAGRERRKARRPDMPPPSKWVLYAPRTIAAALDVACVSGLALFGTSLLGASFWPSFGVAALLYFTASTIVTGSSPGMRVLQAVRLRAPSLFTDRRTVSA